MRASGNGANLSRTIPAMTNCKLLTGQLERSSTCTLYMRTRILRVAGGGCGLETVDKTSTYKTPEGGTGEERAYNTRATTTKSGGGKVSPLIGGEVQGGRRRRRERSLRIASIAIYDWR